MIEEVRKVHGCDMEKFGALDSSEETIAILGDRCRPQTTKHDGDKIRKQFFFVMYCRNVLSAQMLEASLFGVRTVFRLERDPRSMVK